MILAPVGAEKNIKNAVESKAMTLSTIVVPGFVFNGIACGLKKNGDKDLGLIFSETPAVAAGAFTKNWIKAAPVLLTRERLGGNRCQTILVNSGNANACTGDQGETDGTNPALVGRSLFPGQVCVLGVNRDAYDFGLTFPEFIQGLIKSQNLSGTYERKIEGIEKQDNIFTAQR